MVATIVMSMFPNYKLTKGAEKAHRLRGKMLKTLQMRAKEFRKDLMKTYKTWDAWPWLILTPIKYSAGDVHIYIEIDNPIFNYLDQGTDERWAVMHKYRVGKTRVGEVMSYPGYLYKPVIRGRQAMQARNIQPRPGIKGRGWVKILAEIHQKELYKDLARVLIWGINEGIF